VTDWAICFVSSSNLLFIIVFNSEATPTHAPLARRFPNDYVKWMAQVF
jgi:hypothetical protein